LDYKTNGAPIHVLEDINLDVREYEFVSLIGPSGCGKSTIVKLLSGVVVRPSSGTAMIRNSDVQSATKKKEVGVVFQRASLMPWRTVLSNVLLPLEISGNISKESMTRAKELLKFMGLAGFENAYPHTLSGGMQQRVALARALAFDPKILLMDEPFGALDAITRHKLAVELLRIWTQFRKTVLFVTHDISEALFLSDRVVVLSRRPAHVKQIITVDLPRPREVEMQETPKFLAWGREVRKLLEDAE
jgi:NitT/TauT family transport system ATP-binding protein